MATLAATPTTGVAGSDSNGGNLSYKDKQKLKRKERKKNKKSNKVAKLSEGQSPANGQIKNEDDGNAVVIEYTTENPLDSIERDDPLYGELSEILSKFGNASEGLDASDDPDAMDTTPADDKNAAAVGSAQDGNDDLEDDDEDTGKKLSKRQKRLARRLDIAVLKQLVKRPELVDACDPASTDPFLLVHLKSQRNSVPIPRHWQQRRKYLQGKRGIEKIPFELPDYIKTTGIQELRQALLESESQKKLKSKQRERLQPKMNKMDIDYQILHDAFFRHQTKPKMSTIGDVYYEGKEFEVNLKEKAPGELSEELRRALGMPDGAPPPWLILMQQHHGPPPAYPRLKIPGVNCNIPLGAQWGFHPGGWGTAPLDKEGRPRWGWFDDLPPTPDQLAVDKGFRWGMLAPEPEVSDEEEEEEFEQPEEEEEEPAPAPVAPVATVPGIESTVGLEAPAEFELRKVRRDDHPRELYQVLPQQATTVGGATYGSAHTYVVPGAAANKPTAAVDLMKSQKTAAIEVALNPEEVANMSQSELNKKYEQLLKEQEKAKNQALVSKVTDMDVEPKKKDSKKKKDKKEYKF